MPSAIQSDTPPRKRLWIGRTLSAIAVLFLIFDGVIHIMVIAPVVESFNQLGYPVDLALPLGIIEILCLALYLIPTTSILGAVLLTGYLGGAIATQLRVGAPLLSTTLFPIYIGIMFWGGLFLRDARLHSLFPLRKTGS